MNEWIKRICNLQSDLDKRKECVEGYLMASIIEDADARDSHLDKWHSKWDYKFIQEQQELRQRFRNAIKETSQKNKKRTD